jgi:hypothetical protein
MKAMMYKTLTFQTEAMTMPPTMNLHCRWKVSRHKQDQWRERRWRTCRRYRWWKHD